MASVFDENSLREEIIKTWGEHGAHIEVYDHVLKLARVGEATVKALKKAGLTQRSQK